MIGANRGLSYGWQYEGNNQLVTDGVIVMAEAWKNIMFLD